MSNEKLSYEDMEEKIIRLEKELEQYKHFEKEYVRSDNRLSSLTAHVPCTIYLCLNNPTFDMVFLNEYVEKLTGYSKEDFLSKRISFVDLYHEEDRSRILQEVEIPLSQGRTFKLSYRIWHKNGFLRWVEEEGTVVHIDNQVYLEGFIIDITDRVKFETTMQQRESYLTSIIENQPGLVWLKDSESCFLAVNRSFAKSCGLMEPEKLAGKNDFDIWPHEMAEKYRADDFRVMKSGKSKVVEEEIFDQGKSRWFETFKTPVFDVSGKVIGTTGYSRDISERKRTEKALMMAKERAEENERNYRGLFDNSRDGIVVIDSEGRIINCNQAFCLMLGYSLEELKIMNIYQFTPEKWQEWEKKEIFENQLLKNGFTKPYEKEYIRKDGTVFPVNLSAYTYTGADGITFLCGVVRDITERKKIEEALRESEEIFRQFMDNSPIYVFFKDEKMRSIRLSRNYEKMLERPIEDLLGKSMDDLFPSDFAKKIVEDDLKILKEGRQLSFDEDFNGRNYTTIKFPIHIEGKPRYLAGYTIDITDRRKAEDALHNVQKLESLGILAGGIAHDFNNLLGGIFGYIDLARMETSSENRDNCLASALAAIDRARSLTHQLLTFAKGGAPIKKIEKFMPFIQETAQFALSGSPVSCHFEMDENLWSCEFDKNQIGQVIDNIVINAQQAMPGGGVIDITLRNISVEKDQHPLLKSGKYVKISIRDYGIGIPKDFLPRIFDPFFTTKPKGHGLGLATCFSVIARHEGSIEVESEPGKGSVFHVFLPASSQAAENKVEKKTGMHKGSGIFLVMDDEELIRRTMVKMLEAFGYQVVLAENGKNALELFKSELAANRKIAGMIFDLTIPGGMGGKETIIEIRKIDPYVPVFVSSGYGDDPVMSNPGEYGFTASINKPFMLAEFSKMLNDHMK